MIRATHIKACCLLFLTLLGGCSVGGFQGSDNTPSPAPHAPSYKVNGLASKGIIRNGTVSFYALNSNGSLGTLLKTASTNAFGVYSASLNHTGATLVTASGSYTDESTGLDSVIPPATPLRAAVDSILNEKGEPVDIVVTPLTELAVCKTLPLLVSDNISAANKLVSDVFKVDIVKVWPLDPAAKTLFDDPAVPQAQKDYSLVLAAISQMAHDYYRGSVTDTVAAMHNDLVRGDMLGEVTRNQFQASLAAFLRSDQNRTGVRDIKATNLTYSGGSTKVIRVATRGTLAPGTSISGISVTITLPPKMTVRVANFKDYTADETCVKASGAMTGGTAVGRFVPATDLPPSLIVSVAQAASTSLGEFLTVVCDTEAGAAYSAADFSLSSVKVVDNNGVELPGVIVEIL